MHRFLFLVVLLVAVAIATSAGAAPTQAPLLERIGDFPLPGRATRWDYVSIDHASGKLALAHLGDDTVTLVNTQTRSVLGQAHGLARVHGVLAVPELGRIYATATGTDELVVMDERSLAILARIPVGRYPDGLAYAPAAGKIYVSDKDGGTESVVDTHTNRRVAIIDLGGEVGNSQYDPGSGHVFINAQGRRELVEVDPRTDRIVGRTSLPGARGNHGLLIEPTLRLAFIGCEGNDKLLVLSLDQKRVLADLAVDGEPDVLAYDRALGILYVATESGPVHLFRVRPNGVSKLGAVSVGVNAHTLAVDPVSHALYFPLRQGAGSVLRVMRPGRE
jgi:DNA-binding beta-propeller fold protein YncE